MQEINDEDIRPSYNQKRFEKVNLINKKFLVLNIFVFIYRLFIYNQYLPKKQKKKLVKLQVSLFLSLHTHKCVFV
jgi:hypothetical protein